MLSTTTSTEWLFRNALKNDWNQVSKLLTEVKLPLEGAEEALTDFTLAFRDEELVGSAGLERYGKVALLRSVAVVQTERNSGLGQELVHRLLDWAYEEGIEQVVLLTTTAANFFPRFGFHSIPRTEMPQAAKVSAEFSSVCPASATVMLLDLKRPAVLVRTATEADLPDITRIYNQGIEDKATLETELRSVEERREWLLARTSRHPVLVAVQQGKVLGWALLNPFSPRQGYRFVADISIYIARENRYQGFGSSLMPELIRRAKALDYHKLALSTFPFSAGVSLYERSGFTLVGDYHEQGLLAGKWVDTRIMELLLHDYQQE